MAEEDFKCPICFEDLDLTDRSFKPCNCGFQVCLWCYKDIKEKLNGRCPACRAPYKDQVESRAPDAAQLQKEMRKSQAAKNRRKEKRARGTAQGSAGAMDKKALATMRVLQRNLMYVVGLSGRIAKEEILKKKQFFGKFGKLLKIVVNKKVLGNGVTSYCAYVTFRNAKDAELAIKKINGSILDGTRIKATYGTTKYCTNFLRGITCTNPTCLYLHYLARPEDCFSKEDLSSVDTFNYQELLDLSKQASVPSTIPQAATRKLQDTKAQVVPSAPVVNERRPSPNRAQETPVTTVRKVWDLESRKKRISPKSKENKPKNTKYTTSQKATDSVGLPMASPSKAYPSAATVPTRLENSDNIFKVRVPEVNETNTSQNKEIPEPPGLSFLSRLAASPKSPGRSLFQQSFQQPLGENSLQRDVWKTEGWRDVKLSKPKPIPLSREASIEVERAASLQSREVKTPLSHAQGAINGTAHRKIDPMTQPRKWDFNKFVKDVLPQEDFMPGFSNAQLNGWNPSSHSRSGSRYSFVGAHTKHVSAPPGFSHVNVPNGRQGSPGEKMPVQHTEELLKDLRAVLPRVNINFTARSEEEPSGQRFVQPEKMEPSSSQHHLHNNTRDFGYNHIARDSKQFHQSTIPDSKRAQLQHQAQNGLQITQERQTHHMAPPGYSHMYGSSTQAPPRQANLPMHQSWQGPSEASGAYRHWKNSQYTAQPRPQPRAQPRPQPRPQPRQQRFFPQHPHGGGNRFYSAGRGVEINPGQMSLIRQPHMGRPNGIGAHDASRNRF